MKHWTIALGALAAVAGLCGCGAAGTSTASRPATTTSPAPPPATPAPGVAWAIGDCAVFSGLSGDKLPCTDGRATHRVTAVTAAAAACPAGTSQALETVGRARVICFASGTADLGTSNDGVLTVGSCVAFQGGTVVDVGVGHIGGTPVEVPCDSATAIERVVAVGTVGGACPSEAVETLTSGVDQFCLARL